MLLSSAPEKEFQNFLGSVLLLLCFPRRVGSQGGLQSILGCVCVGGGEGASGSRQQSLAAAAVVAAAPDDSLLFFLLSLVAGKRKERRRFRCALCPQPGNPGRLYPPLLGVLIALLRAGAAIATTAPPSPAVGTCVSPGCSTKGCQDEPSGQ